MCSMSSVILDFVGPKIPEETHESLGTKKEKNSVWDFSSTSPSLYIGNASRFFPRKKGGKQKKRGRSNLAPPALGRFGAIYA